MGVSNFDGSREYEERSFRDLSELGVDDFCDPKEFGVPDLDESDFREFGVLDFMELGVADFWGFGVPEIGVPFLKDRIEFGVPVFDIPESDSTFGVIRGFGVSESIIGLLSFRSLLAELGVTPLGVSKSINDVFSSILGFVTDLRIFF